MQLRTSREDFATAWVTNVIFSLVGGIIGGIFIVWLVVPVTTPPKGVSLTQGLGAYLICGIAGLVSSFVMVALYRAIPRTWVE